MNGDAITLLDNLKRLCSTHNNEKVWQLATTHASALPQPTATLALWQLGNLGLEFILAWHHVRTQQQRDSQTLSTHFTAFMSSSHWVHALVCDETSSFFSVGHDVHIADMNVDTKKVLACATLGAGFLSGRIETLELTLATLGPYYYDVADSIGVNPKSQLQAFAQRIKNTRPTYSLLSAVGPEHNQTFTIQVTIPGTRYNAEGHGQSKKAAEQDAANALLRKCNVSSTKPTRQSKSTLLTPRKLDDAGVTAWRMAIQKGTTPKMCQRPQHAQPFATFFKEQTEVSLPLDVTEIVVAHLNSNSNLYDVLGCHQSALSRLECVPTFIVLPLFYLATLSQVG